MPFKEVSVMDQRRQLVAAVEGGELGVSAARPGHIIRGLSCRSHSRSSTISTSLSCCGLSAACLKRLSVQN